MGKVPHEPVLTTQKNACAKPEKPELCLSNIGHRLQLVCAACR